MELIIINHSSKTVISSLNKYDQIRKLLFDGPYNVSMNYRLTTIDKNEPGVMVIEVDGGTANVFTEPLK